MATGEAICERCGCSVRVDQLLYHEAMHDQQMLLFEAMERQLNLSNEAINLVHELVNDLEGRVDRALG